MRILIIDDAGQHKWETVAYTCTDVRGETVYITQEGLQYSRDALRRKHQYPLLERLDELCKDLAHPDIVIWDPSLQAQDTLLYYRRVHFQAIDCHQLVCLVVKVRAGLEYFYNVFIQQSGKVKGYNAWPPAAFHIWYINPRKRPKHFGIRGAT